MVLEIAEFNIYITHTRVRMVNGGYLWSSYELKLQPSRATLTAVAFRE